MTPSALQARIAKLRVRAPVTESYGHALIARGIWTDEGVWYRDQKEHWLGWLSEYNGPGAYGRKNWKKRSAEFVYNHIGCPPMLLWLAEAVGVTKRELTTAKRLALSGRASRASHCALIRKSIPWSRIEETLGGRDITSRTATKAKSET